MARRKDLAGIAALAGLGMLMANRSKKGTDEDAKKRQIATDKDANEIQSDKEDMRKRAFDEGNKVSEGERVSRYKTDRYIYDDAGGPNMPTVKPGGGLAASAVPAASVATGFKKNPGAVSPSLGNQRGPKAEELAAYTGNRNVNFSNEGRQTPVGQTSVSANQIPSQSVKAPTGGERADSSETERNINAALTVAGVGGAGATAYKAKKMYDASQKAKAAAEAAGKGREAVTNPLSWMAGPKNAGKFSGEVPAAGRESVTNPMSWMAGPKNAGKFKEEAPSAMDKAKAAAEKFADRFRKKPLDEADTTGGAIGYKRGGKVRGYASGGSVSSASSRADGIATKGKTRGKIY
jgi:hypothetical protein